METEVKPRMSSSDSFTVREGYRRAFPVTAATSRAMPTMDRQSDRFGVTPISRTVSDRSSASASSFPSGRSGGSIMIPDASPPIPSSSSEQSIPSDASPRIRALRITSPPGRIAPTVASGTTSPARMFVAPQTTGKVASPVETRQRDR